MRTSAQGRVPHRFGFGLAAAAAAVLAGGCHTNPPPEQHFYDVHIQPIFNTFCVGNTSPCHSLAPDPTTGQKTALGNLDLSSFEGVQKRRDVLRTYGSYPQPLLLLKAMPPGSIQIPYQGSFYPSEIRHSGGSPISPNTDAYFELKSWLDNGANRDGIAPQAVANHGAGQCNDALPPASQRLAVDRTSQAYQDFKNNVQPFLVSSCAYATCHSSVQADMYLTCGTSDDETDFNYAQVAGFVIAPPADPTMTNVDQSEILLRPLAVAAGGVSHTGGTFFQSRMDSTWLYWESWAKEVQTSPPLPYGPKTAGQTFFEANVMPKLLVRGCDLEGCHSPDGFNDFRLRSGAFGFFAPAALTRNNHALADDFMAFDTVDVFQSRAVKKNILADEGGTTHRAGPILEDLNASATDPCPQPFDPATSTRAVCVFEAWQQIERQDRAATVSSMKAGDVLPLVFVARKPSPHTLLEFDSYEGGTDLKLADATLDATGKITSVGNVRSALGPCAGLAGQDVDVRGPEWSYDGTKVVFAARPGAAGGLDLWMLDVGAGTCTQLTSDNGRMVSGIRVHNFDPAFAPDNTIVFASTRAGTLGQHSALPQSDLFRVKPTAAGGFSYDFGQPEQMTFLLNSELSPAFMQDGRVSFTAEKATPTFYQLSGRRMNWDLTDYHPLLAQRAQSTSTFDDNLLPSVGYQQATEIREGLDRNFLLILSNEGALGGGGALATFNRSIGPFEADRDDVTFVKSMVIVDPAAAPAADGTTTGAYRSPFSLPNGEILASYAANVTNATTDTPQYALVAVSEQDGSRRLLAQDAALSYVEAALGYKRGETEQFVNLPQLVFGGHAGQDSGNNGVMHFPDVSVLATLLGANLRRGRDVGAFDSVTSLKVWKDTPPPAGFTTADIPANALAYQNLQAIGSADLKSDHSLLALIPAQTPLILEFDDASGKPVFQMTEEHQVTPGEYITPGPPRAVFNNICGGCHGSLSGSELDVAVSADALTGATASLSAPSSGATPQTLH
jgi:hypothetical protein